MMGTSPSRCLRASNRASPGPWRLGVCAGVCADPGVGFVKNLSAPGQGLFWPRAGLGRRRLALAHRLPSLCWSCGATGPRASVSQGTHQLPFMAVSSLAATDQYPAKALLNRVWVGSGEGGVHTCLLLASQQHGVARVSSRRCLNRLQPTPHASDRDFRQARAILTWLPQTLPHPSPRLAHAHRKWSIRVSS